MKLLTQSALIFLFIFLSTISNASSLSEDAINRGINKTCSNYLNQLESLYALNGLNITFAHPENPSKFPSLHISSKNYKNGSSSFSATLIPENEYCYVSTTLITLINDQSCNEIIEFKINADSNLQISSYAEGEYTVLTPADNSYQEIITEISQNSCSITETRMMWPGR